MARLGTAREDIRIAAVWHDAPFIRKRFGERGVKIAVCLSSPALQAVLLYRLQAAARRHRIPLVPSLCRRLSIIIAQVEIGEAASIGPGLHINHGHVVIDGPVVIGPACSISPFVTIGVDTGGAPDERMFGAPRIGRFVFIGTGAKLFGPSPSATTPGSERTPSSCRTSRRTARPSASPRASSRGSRHWGR